MQRIQFKISLVISTIFFLAQTVFASSVIESEFEMLLPRTFQQNLIEQQWQSLQREEFKMSWALADQNYDTPDVKVQLEGLTLNLQTKLQRPDIDPGGESVILQSKDLQAHLNVQAVVVDQYIVREIGGVIGRFRIQARCENVDLRMQAGKGAFEMLLTPVFEDHLVRARLDDVKITWTQDAWSLEALNCTGAEGFDDVVRDEILKISGDSSILNSRKAQVMESIQEYLSAKSIDLSKPRSLVISRPDIKASLQVHSFAGSADKAVVRGLMSVEFARGKSGDSRFLKLSADSLANNASNESLLRVPEQLVVEITKQAFLAGSWFERISSNKIPGFTALMNSRLNQFAVWPELLRYPKSTEFLFDLGASQGVKVKGSLLNYHVDAPLQARMYAPQDCKYVPFMTFAIPLQSEVALAVEQGKVLATFQNVSISLNHRWDPEYVRKYGRYQKFSGAKISERVTLAAEGSSASFLLPKIPLSETLSLRVQKVRPQHKGDLVISLR